jgi:hypothetical protein
MSLEKNLLSFFKKENIECIDIKNVLHLIRKNESENVVLDDFWEGLLKNSSNNSIFNIKKFNELLDNMRFSQKDIVDFLDSEYSGINNEEIIKNILNTKEQVLGKKCTNIKFDLLLRDALWGLDIDNDQFFEIWESRCRKVDIVEKNTREKTTYIVLSEENFGFSDVCPDSFQGYDKQKTEELELVGDISIYV